MQATVEFRTRPTPDTAWELSPVRFTKPFTSNHLTAIGMTHRINRAAAALAAEWGAEVRWNFEGQTQGHYVSNPAKG